MDVEEFVAVALTTPINGYRPLGKTWGITPFSTHRDADTLTRANWETITTDLKTRFSKAFDTLRARHWGFGWIDQLLIDTTNTAAVEAAIEWLAALADYPVADDAKLAEIEAEAIREAITSHWNMSEMCRAVAYDDELALRLLIPDEDGEFAPWCDWKDGAEAKVQDAMRQVAEFYSDGVSIDIKKALELLR